MFFESNFYWIANYVNCHLYFCFEKQLILWTRISFPNCGAHSVEHIANTSRALWWIERHWLDLERYVVPLSPGLRHLCLDTLVLCHISSKPLVLRHPLSHLPTSAHLPPTKPFPVHCQWSRSSLRFRRRLKQSKIDNPGQKLEWLLPRRD